MPVLGKRRHEANSVAEIREKLCELSNYSQQLANILPSELASTIVPILSQWKNSDNLISFYYKNRTTLVGLKLYCDIFVSKDEVFFEDATTKNATDAWNNVAESLAEFFKWDYNKEFETSICV